jgi:hypothetical protein
MKELLYQVAIKNAFLIHFSHFGAERLVSELAHIVTK